MAGPSFSEKTNGHLVRQWLLPHGVPTFIDFLIVFKGNKDLFLPTNEKVVLLIAPSFLSGHLNALNYRLLPVDVEVWVSAEGGGCVHGKTDCEHFQRTV